MKRFHLVTLLSVLLLSVAGEAVADDDDELKSLLEKVVEATGGIKVAEATAWTQMVRFKDPKLGVAIHRHFVELPDKFRSEVEFESNTADGKKRTRLSTSSTVTRAGRHLCTTASRKGRSRVTSSSESRSNLKSAVGASFFR